MVQPSFNFEAPRSRRNDPASSRRAAEQLQKSGAADSQRQICFELVKKFPGRSSKELAQLSGLDRHMIAKRLPELRDKFKTVRVTQTGKEDQKWWAV
jgi:predicted HTH transcriptional regulator